MFLRIPFFILAVFFSCCHLSHAFDCGLRAYDGKKIVVVSCEVLGADASPLRVSDPQGAVWGISVVDPGTPDSLNLRVAYTDASGKIVIKALGYISPNVLSACEELQLIGYHPKFPIDMDYTLTGDVDCSATKYSADPNSAYAKSLWGKGYAVRFPNGVDGLKDNFTDGNTSNDDDVISALSQNVLGNRGFKPIGTSAAPFSKTFDGKGYKISHLYINRPGESYLGFFGVTNGAVIQDVGLVGGTVMGFRFLGSLVGSLTGGSVTKSYARAGSVTGVNKTNEWGGYCDDCDPQFVGGLLGYGYNATITDSCAKVAVSQQGDWGGLYFGGLAGVFSKGTVNRSYATGNVSPTHGDKLGGLIGYMKDGNISDSYATGSVSGSNSIGGLVGEIIVHWTDKIINSYASGAVCGYNSIGGLVGYNWFGEVRNSFSVVEASLPPEAVGSVSPGGFVGGNYMAVPYNVWWHSTNVVAGYGYNIDRMEKAALLGDFYGTGSGTGGAVYGNSAAAGQPSNAWDFVNIWEPVADGLPHLRCSTGKTWNSVTGVCENVAS